MNVWIRKTRRRVKCFYCHKMIETGEYQVVCQYFMKLKHSEKTWTKTMHFHAQTPNCWLERAIMELESRPVIETRGRKPDAMGDEMKERRRKILRRRASVVQRIGEATNSKKIGKLSHLFDLLEQLKIEIEPFGGVPKSWG